jgi:hypothetical protein|tara:strand:- start:559 stop:891 length:333 start_codon:yes stop_codon:yes gene_type:complete
MAFVRKKVKTFKWPVEVQEPSSDRPGEFDTFEFTAVFKRVKISEIEKMGDDSGLPLVKKVLVGWEGIEDEDGKPVPFSSDELALFADDVDWLKAVLASYTKTYADAESGN